MANVYAEMLEEHKRDLENVLELIKIEQERGKKTLTSKELSEHDRRWIMLKQEKYELMQKVAGLKKKVKRMEVHG